MNEEIIYSCSGEKWNKEIILDRNGEERKIILVFTGEKSKEAEISVRLKGRKSRAEVIIAYLGRGDENTSLKVVMAHEAPETYGRALVKAALFEDSRFFMKGLLRVEPEAKGSDTYLSAHALMVSPKSRAEIYPYLEIETDDIKASHGSSIGRIDNKILFYLQSRGIEKKEAEKIYLKGYFKEMAEYLPSNIFDREKSINKL